MDIADILFNVSQDIAEGDLSPTASREVEFLGRLKITLPFRL